MLLTVRDILPVFENPLAGCEGFHSGFITNMARHNFLPVDHAQGSDKGKKNYYDSDYILWIYILFKLSRYHDLRRFLPMSLKGEDRDQAAMKWGMRYAKFFAEEQKILIRAITLEKKEGSEVGDLYWKTRPSDRADTMFVYYEPKEGILKLFIGGHKEEEELGNVDNWLSSIDIPDYFINIGYVFIEALTKGLPQLIE